MAADLAGLGDHFEFGEFFNQLARDMRAFTNQHQDFSVFESD